MSMTLRRSEILAQIAAGKSDKWIAWNYGHGRHLIREVRAAHAADPSQIYVLRHALGAPTKLRSEVLDRINTLTVSNREMSSVAIAEIITATPGMDKLSATSIDRACHRLGHKLLPVNEYFTE
jgi:hypothetical protein